MLREKPFVSVVVPTYNACRFLPGAIASVRAQNYQPLEIILVDDGSTDDTQQLVRNWNDVRYVSQPNQGPAAARNTGIDAARGEILAFLDADDLWTLNHLSVLLAALAGEPESCFAWGRADVVRIEEHPGGKLARERMHENVPQFLIGSGVYRRSAFEQVGRFDPALRLAEDIDWILTARQRKVPHVQVAETVLIYHKREGSLTSGKSFHELNVMTALKRQLHRRRSQVSEDTELSADRRTA